MTPTLESDRGKAVVVTGAASGIGRACVEMAIGAGMRVLAVDRVPSVHELPGGDDLRCEIADVCDVASAPRLVERCIESFGQIDGLVNAAGAFQTRTMLEITPEDFDRLFAVNVRALFFLQQAAAAEMQRRGAGSIVNIASTAARVPRPLSSHYAAGKAAVVSLTRSAAVAFGPSGVRVNAVCPGIIDTPMHRSILAERAPERGLTAAQLEAEWVADNPLGRVGRPEEVAQVIVFLLSDASGYVSGESIGINGGTNDI